MKRTKKDDFTSGVLILSLSAVIVKIIGLVYKIPMLRLLGSEGMGYFNSAYEIYTLFCTVATTGLPVAMSVMISSRRDGGGAKEIFRSAMKLFIALGVVSCGIMIAFAKPFAVFLGNGRAAYCILAIAPTVFFICLSSAYRGYFQGKSRMAPTAVSQIIEASGKLILGLLFAFIALSYKLSPEAVAAFAVMGLTLGTLLSVLYLALTKRFSERKDADRLYDGSERGIVKRLLRTAIPITLSSAVISVTKVIDMSMILKRLQSLGVGSEDAFAAYGNYTTLALPLFSLAPALISCVAMPLIPSLSGAVASCERAKQTEVVGDAIKLTAIISMPISLGLTLFSEPLLRLIFSGQEEAILSAAPLLGVLGISVWLSCMITVGNAVLQALGRASAPLFSMVLGSVAKIVIAYILIGNENVGIMGAPISTFFCDLIINAVNFYFICKSMPRMPGFGKTFLRPAIAAAVSVSVGRLIYNYFCSRVGEGGLVTLSAIFATALLYFLCLFIFGAIGKDDIEKLPIVGSLRIDRRKQDI